MNNSITFHSGLRQKMTLVPGKRYPGSICINEYGEIDFTLSQKGTNPQETRELKRGDGWAIFTTKNTIKVNMRFPKAENFVQIAKMFMKITCEVQSTLMNYRFK